MSAKELARSVNIESVGDTPLGGSVSFIGSEARTERGVISYAVRIRVEVPTGISVPISLSAASAVIMGNDTALLNGSSGYSGNRTDFPISVYGPSPYLWQDDEYSGAPAAN